MITDGEGDGDGLITTGEGDGETVISTGDGDGEGDGDATITNGDGEVVVLVYKNRHKSITSSIITYKKVIPISYSLSSTLLQPPHYCCCY